ncbi:hypothetical protein [Nocardioides sp. AX2bis]|uniref:hypothetical protein n=1 Tax=Nocardioides sp. AX2bis TaxID=2653157 RepID=UPI0012F240CA|nr:hypothetical protein [Nocardioides sp. AX2bis]VXC18289.1 conserved exported hypothetical protein [Nocardioides sp. AX2bis]
MRSALSPSPALAVTLAGSLMLPLLAAGPSAAAEVVSTSSDPAGDVSIDRDVAGLSDRNRRSIDLGGLEVRRTGAGGLRLAVDLARLAPVDARWDQLVVVRLRDRDDDGLTRVFLTSVPDQRPFVASRTTDGDAEPEVTCEVGVSRAERSATVVARVPAPCAAPARARGTLQVVTTRVGEEEQPWSGDQLRVRPLRPV